MKPGSKADGPALEDTTDPLLQRAITEVSKKPVDFRLPVSQPPPAPAKTTAFNSMRSILAPPQAILASGGAAVAAVPVPASEPKAAKTPEKVPQPPQEPPQAAKAPSVKSNWLAGVRGPSVAWIAGGAVFGVFVLVNAVIGNYYSTRVYPGVKVGQTDLSGVPLSELQQKLAGLTHESKLVVEVGATKYSVSTGKPGRPDIDEAVRAVEAVGRNSPLPLAGAVQSWWSQPVQIKADLSSDQAKVMAAELAGKISHKASDALPLVVNGQAFVVTEKAGSRVDEAKLAADLKSAYGDKDTLKLTPEKLTPLVSASGFAADVQEAQAKLALSLQVKVRSASYNVSAAQIGNWLVFSGPGKGVAVDGAAVSAYVASLPGTFDRNATVSALVAAVQNKQNLSYQAPTKKSAAPKLASLAAAWPVRTLSYCVTGDDGASVAALNARAGIVLASTNGWGLGGRLKFLEGSGDCNFSISLMPASQLSELSPQCSGKTTCRVDNTLAISQESWVKAPESWKGGLDAYRGEMINHEVGHWLGFDHASCTAKSATPVLTAPTLVLSGCSPNWYAVPAETQASKVLDGF